ncbi:MAG: class I SAM-dependent methyltransferase, partial [Oscillospiraceae bacterium]|nr:class I SAM-dependent methyltransferase [Oscillospiraceae bacterium]
MNKDKLIKKWDEISNSDWYTESRADRTINKIIKNPKSVFHCTIWEMLNKNIANFKGKKICVPSSGDNHAVFAFSLLGADVTSCDISKNQIESAKTVAEKNNLNIEFICDDTTYLGKITDNTYDLVYTSNGVHVWIDDLISMYININRILKKGGIYIMHEIHPFNRPFSY